MKGRTGIAFALILILLPPAHAGLGLAALTDNQRVLHILNRIGFGPRPGDIERVKKMGLDAYIEQQLHPERIDDSATEALLARFPSIRMDGAEIAKIYVPAKDIAPGQGVHPLQKLLQELQGQKLVRAVSSERQLDEVMVDFWYNHFNIFWGKGLDKSLTTGYEMNAIRPHALGKFKDLVMATAQHPAMLFYLDNALSSSPDTLTTTMERLEQLQREPFSPRREQQIDRIRERLEQQKKGRRPGINENYARELMELHTMGVDGGYTQKDVQEVARAFTGWTIDRTRENPVFVFRAAMHDPGEKVVLGRRIGAEGMKEGERVIDILVRHPSTARFIATKLVRRFVNDAPPGSLVDRVASVYTQTDGDIRQMLRAILTSGEFFSAEAYRAKTKSPFELAVSSIRALGASTNGGPRLAQAVATMGQPLYRCQAPTGFPDRASQWNSSGALLERINFGIALASNRIPGTPVELSRFADESASADVLVQRAADLALGGDISERTRKVVAGQVASPAGLSPVKAFSLVLGSPEFQKR